MPHCGRSSVGRARASQARMGRDTRATQGNGSQMRPRIGWSRFPLADPDNRLFPPQLFGICSGFPASGGAR